MTTTTILKSTSTMTPRYFDKKNLLIKTSQNKKDLLSKFESDDQVTLLYNFGFAKTNSEKEKVTRKTTKKSQVVQENLLGADHVISTGRQMTNLLLNFESLF